MRTEELKALLSEMSLEEKIGELFQIPAYFFDGGNATGPAMEMGIQDEDIRVAGSCLTVTGAEKVRQIQSAHMKSHPHHIPMLFMADVINGFHTIFPIPLAQGCSFDPELVEHCASISAAEAAAAGVHVTFSPMADLSQDARWGRVMEGTGEDPYLNGVMASAMVRGYQGKENRLTEKGKIASCLKHFAGYGAPIGGRDYNSVELSERTLRQDYLPAYQSAINAGCELVMTSFNTLNRIPSSANRWLMRDVLRREMGFEGVLISDWAAIQELTIHAVARDLKEAAELAIQAGVDIDMATPAYIKNLKTLVQQGRISEQRIDEAALRVLTLKNKLGLFEKPFKDADAAEEQRLLLCDEHRLAARDCAEKSFVLLKNEDDLLPLNPDTEKVAFIGPFADYKLLSGSWSFFGDDNDCVTVKEGVIRHYPHVSATFAKGCPMVDPGVEILGFQKKVPMDMTDPESAMAEALKLASSADKVVLLLGEHRDYSGEGASKGNLTLPQCQLSLLRCVSQVNPNVCVVLFNGRPLDLRDVQKYAKSILEAWLPGVEGGNAVARTLYGDAVPSGKLTMSFPYCVGQVPVFYNHMNTGRPFHGDYRTERYFSQYLDIPNQPLYSFGYGLSYTTFSCSDVKLSQNSLRSGESITCSVTVSNTGSRTGTQTVQMYIRDLWGSVTRPVKELKSFRKVTLAPGEIKEVAFAITEPMLRFYDIHMNYTSEPGAFEVFIGFDSNTENKQTFTLR